MLTYGKEGDDNAQTIEKGFALMKKILYRKILLDNLKKKTWNWKNIDYIFFFFFLFFWWETIDDAAGDIMKKVLWMSVKSKKKWRQKLNRQSKGNRKKTYTLNQIRREILIENEQ